MPSSIRQIGLQFEKFFLKYVDAVILADELQIIEFGGINNKKCVIVYDSPNLVPFISKQKSSFFNIFYAGVLENGRKLNIENMISAIKKIDSIKLTIVGEGNLVNEIKKLSKQIPEKIQYITWMEYHKVLEMTCNSDLLFSIRDPYPLVNKYICGSKFLEAIMCNVPIIVSEGTSAAIKVKEYECGLIVDPHNIDDIVKNILILKNNPKLCKIYGLNGKRAYNKFFSYDIMKKRIINIYDEVILDNLNK